MSNYETSKRIPLVLIVDGGKSTHGDYLQMLNHNLERFIRSIDSSERGSSVSLLMVSYSDQPVIKSSFTNLRSILPRQLDLTACDGVACTGKAVSFTLDSLEAKCQEWKRNGIAYTKPICLLLTDDRPVDWPAESAGEIGAAFSQAAQRVRHLESVNALVFAGCAMSQIRRIRCNEKMLREMTDRIFSVRQLPDGVENMEEGFADVISWVERMIGEAWTAAHEEAHRPEQDRSAERPKSVPKMKSDSPADDPFLRFMGIMDEGKD